MNMQADYYAFSQGATPQMAQAAMMTPTSQMQAAVQAAYTAYGVGVGVGGVGVGGFMPFSGYPLGHTLPTHKHLEKIKTRSSKNKTTSSSGDVVVVGRSGSGANNNNKFDEITNSTDESIHLVRSRKTGESAPNRYDGQDSQKKRSQSGNSLVKDSTILTQQQQEEIILQSQQGQAQSQSQSQSQRHRSHSDDRSLSPSAVAAGGVIGSAGPGGHHQSDSASNKAKTKRRSGKERKAHHHHRSHHKSSSVAQQWQQHYGDVTANSCVDQRIMEQYYVPASPYNVMPLQYGGQCCTPTQQGYTQGSAYTEQQQQQQWASEYQQQQAQQQQQQQQQQAQSYIQQQQEQYYGGNQWQPQPSGYDVAPGAPMPVDCSPYPGCVPAPQAYDPCQPNGGAGYGAPSPYYQQDPAAYCQDQYSQPSTSYQCYELPQQPGLPPGAKIVAEYFLGYLDDQPAAVQQQYQQQAYPGYPAPQSSSESSKEECEVEKDSFSEYEEERRTSKDDDLKKLKDDIIKTIQNELGNLKLDSGKDPIQPIFLMPKSNEQSQQKPIYIPRNIYVPVIRPVFVPRERIIVRPQIIHVARPVLVDRPVPIQQRPIVIERDRPVPVRVETIEKTEPLMMGHQANTSGVVVGGGVGASAGELTRNIETGQEVTYHEFTQTYPPPQSSGVNGPNGCVGQQTSQEYHHQSNYQFNDQGGSSADYLDDRKQNLASKSNEDLYQKYGGETTKTIESVLGSSQGYTLEVLDQRISNKFEKTDQETIKARYGVDSYQYLPPGSNQQHNNNNNNNQGSEFYTTQQLGHSGSYKSLASVNNETRISNSNLYGRESGAIGVGAAPSYGGSVGSVDVTSSANVVYGGGSGGASSASPRASMNQSAQSQQHQNVQKIIQSYASYSNDQQNLDN